MIFSGIASDFYQRSGGEADHVFHMGDAAEQKDEDEPDEKHIKAKSNRYIVP